MKKDNAANKENIIVLAGPSRNTSKAKTPGHQRSQSKAEAVGEPWRHMELDEEPNPFKRLDRDFPQLARSGVSTASASKAAAMNSAPADHSDLNSVRAAASLTSPHV